MRPVTPDAKRRVTIRDVAAHASVSPMTVSRVINDDARVRWETRRRVQASVATLGYVPNQIARGLSRRKTGALGVIVPDLANPFFTLVLRGIEDLSWRSGRHVILCNTQADLERERGYIEDMLSFQVEGILIAPGGDRSRSHMRHLARAKVPFVLIDRSIRGFTGDLVQGDSIGGARQLVEHLLRIGHTRIGMVTESDEVSTARDRALGYGQALEAAGLPVNDDLVVGWSATDSNSARRATEQLLTLPDPPTAIFAVNNIAVIGVLEAVRASGLRIPEDVAVVCFDDIELFSSVFPFLTVMAQPAETFGTLATQLLLDRLNGQVGESQYRTVVLPAKLVVRGSCGYRPKLDGVSSPADDSEDQNTLPFGGLAYGSRAPSVEPAEDR
jgi:LacI family transcriptional regulator